MQIEGTVQKVEGRKTSGDPIYFITIDGVDYSTFEFPTAQQANSGLGLRGAFEVDESPNPRNPSKPYKNLIAVLGFHGQPNATPGEIPMQAARPRGGGGGGARGKTPQERAEIARQSTLSTALSFVGSFASNGAFPSYLEARTEALDLAQELFDLTQQAGAAAQAATPAGGATLQTPEGMTPPTPPSSGTWGQE